MKRQNIQPKFLVDDSGKPVAVQLDLKVYEALLEELEDLYDVKRAEKIMAKKPKLHTFASVERALLGRGK